MVQGSHCVIFMTFTHHVVRTSYGHHRWYVQDDTNVGVIRVDHMPKFEIIKLNQQWAGTQRLLSDERWFRFTFEDLRLKISSLVWVYLLYYQHCLQCILSPRKHWPLCITFGKLFTYKINIRGPKMDPWGTPQDISLASDSILFTLVSCYQFVR